MKSILSLRGHVKEPRTNKTCIVGQAPWPIVLLLLVALLLPACSASSGSPATAVTTAPIETRSASSDSTATVPTSGGLPASPTSPASPAIPTVADTPSVVPTAAAAATSLPGNPANGAKLFTSQPCNSCHDITHPYPGGAICPNLGNIATEAERIVHSPDYHGKATDGPGYIQESILNPNAYIVPGAQYRADNGQSVMPKDFGQKMTPAQVDDLVAFLMQHK